MLEKLRSKFSPKRAQSNTTTTTEAPKPQSISPHQGTPESKRAYAALRWGITPKQWQPTDAAEVPESSAIANSDTQRLPPDHPIHKLSKEEQEKLRHKGINPVLKAEMDDAISAKGKRGFWSKSVFGGAWGLAI